MLIRLLTLIVPLLAGCSFSRAEEIPTLIPTSTTVRVVQTTAVPTVSRHMGVVVTGTPDASADTAETACEAAADAPTSAHVVTADLDYRQQTVAVQQQLAYINRTGDTLSQFVLDVEPNRLPGAFTLNALTLDDDTPVSAYELTGRRLTITLPEPLPPDCKITLKLVFQLRIPQIGAGLNGFSGYFGFGARQINLGHWLPMAALRMGGDWILHDNTAVGEQTVSEPADWDVTINVSGASDALVLAGPGTVTQPAPGSWHFVHTHSRDFTVSMSEQFNVASRQTEDGVTVELYSFDDAVIQSGVVDGAAHVLDMATRSLSMYSDLFGAYPHSRFIVVQGDFPDGMEFNDLVFVSTNWFHSYDGDPQSYLTIITVHEVSHQWWYARVGNDQATTPWLDESLATYSEYIFYEEYFPELRDWWWEFRVNTFIPPDFDDRTVDSTVYEFTTVREYINAVYLRGARMLHDLRRDVGTNAFFEWLRQYAEAGSGQIATPDLFWSLLTPEQLERTRQTREQYLGMPAGATIASADG